MFALIIRKTLTDFDYFEKLKQSSLVDSMDAIESVVKHVANFNKAHAAGESLASIEKSFHEAIRVSG